MTKPIKYRLHKEWHENLSWEGGGLCGCIEAVVRSVDEPLWRHKVYGGTENSWVFDLIKFGIMWPITSEAVLALR